MTSEAHRWRIFPWAQATPIPIPARATERAGAAVPWQPTRPGELRPSLDWTNAVMLSSGWKPRPAAAIHGSSLSRAISRAKSTRGEPRARREMSRVLMVDNTGLFQILEASFLRRLGCEIVRALDGPDLIEKASACAPDLILLDADGPGIDGAECLRS